MVLDKTEPRSLSGRLSHVPSRGRDQLAGVSEDFDLCG